MKFKKGDRVKIGGPTPYGGLDKLNGVVLDINHHLIIVKWDDGQELNMVAEELQLAGDGVLAKTLNPTQGRNPVE